MPRFNRQTPVILDISGTLWDTLRMENRNFKLQAELVNEKFGVRLARVRKVKGFSQVELGKSVGLSRGSISNIESGIQNVQLHQVFAFANALNAPVAEFLPHLREVIEYEN